MSIKRRYFCDDALDKLTLSKLQKRVIEGMAVAGRNAHVLIGVGAIELAGARAPPQVLTAGAWGHNGIYGAPATVRSVPKFLGPPTYANTV